MVLAGGERHPPEAPGRPVAPVIVGRKRLLEPADAVGVEPGHGLPRVLDRIAGVGVGQDDELVPEGLADGAHPGQVARRRVADAELQGPVARRDQGARLLDERGRLLVAEGDAAGVGRDRPRAPAEQPVERPAHGLAPNIPEGHVDAAHPDRGGRPQPVAAELHLVDPRPDAHHVRRVQAEYQLAEGRVDQVRDGAGRAAVVRLAVAHEPVVGRHLHDDGVALDRPADAERHALARRDRERGRLGLDVGDAHGASPSCLATGRASAPPATVRSGAGVDATARPGPRTTPTWRRRGRALPRAPRPAAGVHWDGWRLDGSARRDSRCP